MNGNIINPDAPVDGQNRDNSKKIHLDFFQEDINTNSTTVVVIVVRLVIFLSM